MKHSEWIKLEHLSREAVRLGGYESPLWLFLKSLQWPPKAKPRVTARIAGKVRIVNRLNRHEQQTHRR